MWPHHRDYNEALYCLQQLDATGLIHVANRTPDHFLSHYIHAYLLLLFDDSEWLQAENAFSKLASYLEHAFSVTEVDESFAYHDELM